MMVEQAGFFNRFIDVRSDQVLGNIARTAACSIAQDIDFADLPLGHFDVQAGLAEAFRKAPDEGIVVTLGIGLKVVASIP